MAPPTERSATGQRIFDAARQLFAQQGYDRTGMREIARAAEVNLAAINYCYGSKAALLSALLDAFFSGYGRAALASYDPELPLAQQCRALAESLSRFVGDNPDLARIAVSQLPLDSPETAAEKARHLETMAADLKERLLRPMLGATADQLPVTLIGPALMALVSSGELFRPMTERLSGELRAPAEGYDYHATIAAIAAHGLPGVIAPGVDSASPSGTSSEDSQDLS